MELSKHQKYQKPSTYIKAAQEELEQIEPSEYILCAAIHYQVEKKYVHQPKNVEKGIVICGRRHHNCIATKSETSLERSNNGVQGFMTNLDRFVDREKAWLIAMGANQVVNREGLPSETLYSEHLY